MSLLVNVIHNPGTTYSKSEMPGFVKLFVSAFVPEYVKEIINKTEPSTYLLGNFITDKKDATNVLVKNNIEIIIPFNKLKEGFDVSGQVVLFDCYISDNAIMHGRINGGFTLGLNIKVSGDVYSFDESSDEIKSKGLLHSVYVN